MALIPTKLGDFQQSKQGSYNTLGYDTNNNYAPVYVKGGYYTPGISAIPQTTAPPQPAPTPSITMNSTDYVNKPIINPSLYNQANQQFQPQTPQAPTVQSFNDILTTVKSQYTPISAEDRQLIGQQVQSEFQPRLAEQARINSMRETYAKAQAAQLGDVGFGQSNLAQTGFTNTAEQGSYDNMKLQNAIAAETAQRIAAREQASRQEQHNYLSDALQMQQQQQQSLRDFASQNLQQRQLDLNTYNTMSDNARQSFSTILTQFGGMAFEDLDPVSQLQLSMTAQQAGIPQGLLRSGLQTVKERQMQQQRDLSMSPIEKEYNFYVQGEVAAGRQPLDPNSYMTMDANRKRAVNNTTVIGGLSRDQFTRLASLRDDARQDPTIKQFNDVRAAYELARSAAAKKNSAGDIILLRMIAKATDPTTGVREEEFKTFEGAQGELAKVGVALTTKMWGSGTLNDYGRSQMMTQMNDLYTQRKNAYQSTVDNYANQAQRYGGTLNDVVPSYYLAPEDGGNKYQATTPDGKVHVFPDQKSLDSFKKAANLK